MLQQFYYNYPFLKITFLGNEIFDWLTALAVFFIAITLLKIIKIVIIARLKEFSKKTETEIDDVVINSINSIHWPFFVFISIYLAIKFLSVPEYISNWSFYIFLVAVVYYAIKAAQSFIDFGVRKIIEKKEEADEHDTEFIKILSVIIKIMLWVLAIILILSNFGINVTSLIAGLGIGGIAVALALQNILGDLFSSFAIYFDKPFKIGDFIIVGDIMGTVEKVGIKTTRILSLQGEQIVMSNNELTKAQIRNFGVMQRRRIVFQVGVTYDTPAEKLRKIPSYIQKIIKEKGAKETTIDRVHFQSFGDSSLIYEVVYYVESGDYNIYMDYQEAINLGIVEKFKQEKIVIAFPTRTIYVKKEE